MQALNETLSYFFMWVAKTVVYNVIIFVLFSIFFSPWIFAGGLHYYLNVGLLPAFVVGFCITMLFSVGIDIQLER